MLSSRVSTSLWVCHCPNYELSVWLLCGVPVAAFIATNFLRGCCHWTYYLEIVPSALTRAWDRQWVLRTSLAALNNPPPPSLPPPLLCAFPEWQFLIILGNAIRSLTTGYGNRSLLECNSSSSQVTQSVVWLQAFLLHWHTAQHTSCSARSEKKQGARPYRVWKP